MLVKRAEANDVDGIIELLKEVNLVHHIGRPDIFNIGTKYTREELISKIKDNDKPIFVCIDEENHVMGHGFCILQQHINDNILTDIKTLYIDDICVGANYRHKSVGTAIYDYIYEYAASIDCYNITLNVWDFNEGARSFYNHCGLTPLKTMMEKVIK